MSTSNWHWRQKDVSAWSKAYLSEKLENCSTPELKVESAKVEGDATVAMRKGKVVTIYDFKVTATWKSQAEADETSGELLVHEVQHDMDEDEYQFEAFCSSTTPEATKLKEVARKKLADKMRPIFQQLPKDMSETHGKDLLASAQGTPEASGTSTPVPEPPKASSSAAPAKPAAKKPAAGQNVNTATVSVASSFMISAPDLFDLLTDDQKVPTWTRNPAKIRAEAGADVSLFGGNILGKVLSAERPSRVVMTWRAPGWPEDHFGTLTISLEQGSSDTRLSLRLEGVPLGKEEETERNLDIYYIRSLKQIGYAMYNFLPPPLPPPRDPDREERPPLYVLVTFGIVTLSIAWALFQPHISLFRL